MLPARSKVVRVEQTLSPIAARSNTHEDLLGVVAEVEDAPNTKQKSDSVSKQSTPPPPQQQQNAGKPKSALRSQHTSTTQEGAESSKAVTLKQEATTMDESTLSGEEEDEVGPLPENWPRIPAIFERRSWDFTTAVAPSVNKASAHIELFQGIIQEWFREAETVYSRASSRHGTHSRPPTHLSHASSGSALPGASRRHFRFHGAETPLVDDLGSERTLSVLGVGTMQEPGHSTPAGPAMEEYQLPYLGAEEVVEEVVALLAKLESDRQETLEELRKERVRGKVLRAQIDSHCHKRMRELPKAVQREHEACAMDIAELNWHVGFQTRNEEQMKRHLDAAQALNNKLRDDIAFIRQHIPLVQEKLELEKESMARIEQAQKDTDDELNVVARRCAKVQAKSNEAHRKAEEERESIRRDLESVREDLARITEELSSAKMNYNSYIHQANDYRQQIQDNEQEVKVLTVKSENAQAAEAIQDVKVKELQKKIKESEYEQKQLEEENVELRDTKEWKKHRNEKMVADLQSRIEDLQDKLRRLRRTNAEIDMDIEDASFKLNECERQKTADDKNVERMIKELARTENEYDMTIEELAQITILTQATREQLSAEEERTMQAEEQLRATAESLKRQVKDEIHSRTMIQARMNADGEEHEKFEAETTQRKQKTQKIVGEVETAVKTVKKKVDKLRNLHREKTKLLDELEREKTRLMEEVEQILQDCERRKTDLTPKFDELKTKVDTLSKQIEQMDWKEDMMTKKMEDMTSSGAMMTKSIKTSSKAIEKLNVELEEVTTKLTHAHQIDEELQSSLDMINTRHTSNDKHHKEHVKTRQEVFEKTEKDLADSLKLNKQLAADYRHLTNVYLFLQNQLLNGWDNNINAEVSIKDLKQLQGLQQKMHAAMAVYYKYRGLYNRSELARMLRDSNANGVRVGSLQGQMDRALDKIADFLQNQLDGDTIRTLAMDRVERMERGEVLSDVASVVTASRPETRMSSRLSFLLPTPTPAAGGETVQV